MKHSLLKPDCPSAPLRPLLLPVLLLLAAPVALLVDWPISRWCTNHNCPDFLRDLLGVLEPFGNGLGVLVIVAAVHQLDPLRRWGLPRLLACSLGAGLAANVVKMLVVRTRPHQFDFADGILATFGGWLPLTSAGSAGQSFPSAHTATAVGLAVGLIWLYPHGRWLFAGLAALVACQRVEAGDHFLSDVLCGAATGCLIAAACLKVGLLPGWFDNWERRLGRRLESAPVPNARPTDDREQAGSRAA